MKHQLFCIEGLPASGKSTTAGFVEEILRGQGKKVIVVDEGTNRHPADYEFHCFLTGEELKCFSAEERALMAMKGQMEGEGLIIPLEGLPEPLFQRLLPHKIYDGLPWDIEKEVMLNGWQHFAENREQDAVYVFNCCLLQNPMCETMMRFALPCGESEAYIGGILNRIRELQPVVIYLSQSRIGDRIRWVARERGEEWLRFVISYHTEGGYGRKHGLQGFDGYIACLTERQRRELSILKELPVKYLVVNDPADDWSRTKEIIRSYVEEM